MMREMPDLTQRAKTLVEMIDSSYFISPNAAFHRAEGGRQVIDAETRELIGRLRSCSISVSQ